MSMIGKKTTPPKTKIGPHMLKTINAHDINSAIKQDLN